MLQLVLTGALLLPIRGGVGVSVMNVGEAYFSKDMRLNHAAVNPVFSLMESLSKQEDFASQYRFMNEGEAERVCLCSTRGATVRKGCSPCNGPIFIS